MRLQAEPERKKTIPQKEKNKSPHRYKGSIRPMAIKPQFVKLKNDVIINRIELFISSQTFDVLLSKESLEEAKKEGSLNQFFSSRGLTNFVTSGGGIGPSDNLVLLFIVLDTDLSKDSMERILTIAKENGINVVFPGYYTDGSFDFAEYNEFGKILENETDGKWVRGDYSQLVVINCISFCGKYLISANNFFAVDVSGCIKCKYAKSILDLFYMLVRIKEDSIDTKTYFNKIEKQLKAVDTSVDYDDRSVISKAKKSDNYRVNKANLVEGVKRGYKLGTELLNPFKWIGELKKP